MRLFYAAHLEKNATSLQLDAEDSRHCTKVLRLSSGEQIALTDGKGGLYYGIIDDPNPKACRVQIQDYQHTPAAPYYIHLAVAPTKNTDRIEWFVEKAVEIGIHEISFFHSRYSERKVLKLQRVERIAIAALKQSVQYYLPKINELRSFESLLESALPTSEKYIAYTQEDVRTNHLADLLTQQQSYLVLIGPEGGFHEEEVALAQSKGFRSISLGHTRLRTETAALATVHMLNLLNR